MRLQVEAFAGRVGGDEDANRVFVGGGVERLPDLFPLRWRCGTVVDRNPVCGPVALRNGRIELLLQVALRVVVFSEDEDGYPST